MNPIDVKNRMNVDLCPKNHAWEFDAYFLETHQQREICTVCGDIRIYPVYFFADSVKTNLE